MDTFTLEAMQAAVLENGPLIFIGVLVLWSFVYRRETLHSSLNNGVSASINIYLNRRYPIRHIEGDRFLPTCPYRFPNGQGDVGKFLQGVENSGMWEKRYGSVYRIWSGMSPEIVLTRLEHIQAVFRDSDKHLKAVNNNSGHLMGCVLGKCVGLVNGDEWKTVRALTDSPFHRKNSINYIPMIQRHVKRYFEDLRNTGRLKKGLLDPAEDMKLLPFWIVAEIFYGELTPEMMTELKDLVPIREKLFRYVIRGGMARFAFSRYIPSKANTLLSQFQIRWKSFNDCAYRRAVSAGLNVPIEHMYREVEADRITMEHMLQTLDESLYANLDVTIGGISWNIVFLAAYKKYQESLLQEINAVDTQNFDRYIHNNSSLLAACISESSRLKPLAPFSVPQAAPTERIIDGYRIPAGANYVIDSYRLNIRNEFWGADSATYRPERFLEMGKVELRYHFWRFGFGPRQCMGKYVADYIIRVMMVHLVRNFDIGLMEADGEWARNPESWITHPRMDVTCVRKFVN